MIKKYIHTQNLQALSASSSSSSAVSWELVRHCGEEPCQTDDHHVLQLVEGTIDPACFKSLC
jgi:hypothetical protein